LFRIGVFYLAEKLFIFSIVECAPGKFWQEYLQRNWFALRRGSSPFGIEIEEATTYPIQKQQVSVRFADIAGSRVRGTAVLKARLAS
jgi:hypothetical protein